jgi:hypothetical protein
MSDPYTRSLYPSMSAESRFRYHLKAKYGLTPEQYDQLFEDANNSCQICERPVTKGGQGLARGAMSTGCIDHCHDSGKVRGVLCRVCNSFLGIVKDDLTKTIKYLGG